MSWAEPIAKPAEGVVSDTTQRRFFCLRLIQNRGTQGLHRTKEDIVPARSSLFPAPPGALRRSARIATALVALAFVGACSTDQPDATGLRARAADARSGVPFTEA